MLLSTRLRPSYSISIPSSAMQAGKRPLTNAPGKSNPHIHACANNPAMLSLRMHAKKPRPYQLACMRRWSLHLHNQEPGGVNAQSPRPRTLLRKRLAQCRYIVQRYACRMMRICICMCMYVPWISTSREIQ